MLYLPMLLFLLLKFDFKLLHQFGEIWLTVNLPPLTPATPYRFLWDRPTRVYYVPGHAGGHPGSSCCMHMFPGVRPS